MACMCDIKPLLNSIINQRKIYMTFDTNNQKCQEYEESKEKRNEAKKLEEQYWNELVEKINEYIQYPQNKKWVIFKRNKKASFKYDKDIGETYIKIPKIEKREYYCLINLLSKMEYFYQFKDTFVLHIEEEKNGL